MNSVALDALHPLTMPPQKGTRPPLRRPLPPFQDHLVLETGPSFRITLGLENAPASQFRAYFFPSGLTLSNRICFSTSVCRASSAEPAGNWFTLRINARRSLF